MIHTVTELVHPVPLDDIDPWTRTMAGNFLSDPHSPDAARRVEILRRVWDPERAWGVRDRDRWVATLRTETRTLTLPGRGEIPVDAVTNVTVSATHRRRGLMRAMLDQSMAAAHARGDAISILIAAEWPIYGRFGYAPATLSADYVLRQSRAGATLAGDLSRVRQVQREEFGAVAAQIFDAARRRPGQIDRSQTWYDRIIGRDGYAPSPELPHHWLLHEGDDGPDGMVAWKADGDGGLIPPLGRVQVWDLATASDAAYRNLWAYLAGIDGSDEVILRNRPVDEPVRWLLHDARTLVMTEQVDFTWLRLLDIPAALTARRYAVPGEVVIEVTNDPFASGRYQLCSEGDDAQCAPTQAAADLRVSQRTLASAYLGGFRLGALTLAGEIQELTAGALERADAMFATSHAPWNATWF